MTIMYIHNTNRFGCKRCNLLKEGRADILDLIEIDFVDLNANLHFVYDRVPGYSYINPKHLDCLLSILTEFIFYRDIDINNFEAAKNIIRYFQLSFDEYQNHPSTPIFLLQYSKTFIDSIIQTFDELVVCINNEQRIQVQYKAHKIIYQLCETPNHPRVDIICVRCGARNRNYIETSFFYMHLCGQ